MPSLALVFQPGRDELVGLGGFCDATRVWVRQDHGRGVLLQGFFDYLARVNRCTIDRALEHFLVADQAVTLVE
jgi:hypothetical protein